MDWGRLGFFRQQPQQEPEVFAEQYGELTEADLVVIDGPSHVALAMPDRLAAASA